MVFFFKQKTAYEMRISDWSSDVCSSDLVHCRRFQWRRIRLVEASNQSSCFDIAAENQRHVSLPTRNVNVEIRAKSNTSDCEVDAQIGRASCRERVCQYV